MLVVRDYLPHIVGPDAYNQHLGIYPGYNENVDPSIANVFATAAFRFAHLAIQPIVSRLNENYQTHSRFPSVPLFEAFFSPWRVIFEGEFVRLMIIIDAVIMCVEYCRCSKDVRSNLIKLDFIQDHFG